jgi:UDP-N-acetylmuramyl pentapeptide phosphotransferase/UDP-N-acetylglucosamine-1-phosphate transferase
MFIFLLFFFNLLIIFLINFFFKKFSFLIDKKQLPHKNLTSLDNIPISGGLIIILNLFIFSKDYILNLFSILIFILGIFSDLFIIKKSLKKFIIQFLILFSFIYFYEVKILSTRIFFIDYFLDNNFFSICLTLFCLLILINGSNFIDGVNTLSCGYFILINLVIIYLINKGVFFYDSINFFYLLLVLFIIFLFNFFSKLYLGDSGAFVLSFIFGYILINISNNNLISISPFFILLLLWYPAFENLFSIIRKYLTKSHPYKPDHFHFHQLLFTFLKNNNFFSKHYANTFSGIFINSYNAIIFFIGSFFYNSSLQLGILIFFNILVYTSFYIILKKKFS